MTREVTSGLSIAFGLPILVMQFQQAAETGPAFVVCGSIARSIFARNFRSVTCRSCCA